MPLKRTEHWATRELHQFFRTHEKTPFAWGSHDCCLFAANAIQAMTGTDIADDFRGKYTDHASAFTLITAVTGGSTVADAAAHCATKHGLKEWVDATGKALPLMAQRGDLVVIADAGQLIAGVVHLNGKHVISVGSDGLKRLPLSAITRAWHV